MVNIEHARRLARVSLLCACALVLSYLETMIPLPVAVPGIKLGLANVAVVVALYTLDVKSAGAVALVKVFASGFLFGSPMMLVYSLGGTVLAFIGMVALAAVPGVGLVPVSMLAAVLHNVGQLGVAAMALQTPAVFINLVPALPPVSPAALRARWQKARSPVLNKPMTHVPPSIALHLPPISWQESASPLSAPTAAAKAPVHSSLRGCSKT
ncbi:MAG: Gx transporter family protein [Collinsella sp.]